MTPTEREVLVHVVEAVALLATDARQRNGSAESDRALARVRLAREALTHLDEKRDGE